MGFFDLGLGDLVSAGAKLIGGGADRDAAKELNERNIANQKEFANNAVSWKVADARRAGISPLAALGASTSSFSNVTGDTSLGDSIKGAGQDISRAMAAGGDREQRQLVLEGMKLDIEKKRLDVETGRSELNAKLNNTTGTAPAVPPLGVLGPQKEAGGTSNLPSNKPDENVQDLTIGGRRWAANPNFSDAQQIQNRHGDIAESIYGLGVALPADIYHNLSPYMRKAYDTYGPAVIRTGRDVFTNSVADARTDPIYGIIPKYVRENKADLARWIARNIRFNPYEYWGLKDSPFGRR